MSRIFKPIWVKLIGSKKNVRVARRKNHHAQVNGSVARRKNCDAPVNGTFARQKSLRYPWLPCSAAESLGL